MTSPSIGETEPSSAAARAPEGTLVYAIGDSHGCVDRLRALHEAILEDAGHSAQGRRVAVYLGDYIDRGPDPRGLVALLIEEPLPGFESVHLIGNHEAFLLRFLADRTVAPLWMMNGGAATCTSYGVDPARPPEHAEGDDWLQRELKARIPETHLAFFGALRPSHLEGDYLFVHAGVRPGVPLDAQDRADLLWIREPFLSSDEDLGKVVVHGHTPTDAPVVRANRIGVDTGACYGGPLTALVLEGGERRFLQV
ncbi:MAG: serine/threonine protein phosphatase [Rhodospirillales bacterium]|nr:serine/threonine protein phosphatase [Rhodospirillales bacterium]MDH3970245.1 serine/threonine protein phosphatase [Rhodospirillales bacterium]